MGPEVFSLPCRSPSRQALAVKVKEDLVTMSLLLTV